MSLINQMLQDLDKRHSADSENDPLSSQIKAVPSSGRRQGIVLLGLGLLIVTVAVLVWVFFLKQQPTAMPKVEQNPLVVTNTQNQPSETMGNLKQSQSLHLDRISTQSEVPVVQPVVPKAQSEKVIPLQPPVKKVVEFHAPASKESVKVPVPEEPIKPPVLLSENEIPVQAEAQVAQPTEIKPKALPAPQRGPVVVNKQVKELTPQQRAESEYRKAIALIQQGRVIEAMSALDQTLLDNPNHASARQTLVGLLLEKKRQPDAEHSLQDGLNKDPGQSGFAMLLARLQVERGDVHGGAVTLLNYLPQAAGRADYVAFLAALLQREGRNKEAIDHYMQAVRLSPQSGVWWMGLGISLQAENRTAEAQDAFSRAKASGSLSPELLSFVEQKLKQLQR
ncbi:tetratricopeptide repeat protein [Sulfurirhabdus autotrophica]|uniref:MSHA biogenesis protein MshN n=1 Tax=Sulfurirhabdus autotrophica TaxID=1706046 RepID=A0A4R3Y0K4_9PROT|nr:tetratricopeptide repeat protein [Sulfurirhabdus autotrophica]TCV84771.1 MSHA biogenesis protein MshN [Sulfurirhabdus autotrophica]